MCDMTDDGVDIYACGSKMAEDTRAHIDEEILRINEQARKLKSRRNALAPISRLPPELLCSILLILSFHVSEEFTSGANIRCMAVTHVCRYFRSVALGCPSLWTHLVCTHPLWTEEMLQRSREAPLVVKDDCSCFEGISRALEHISRIRVLQLWGSSVRLEKLFNQVRTPALLLESLHLWADADGFSHHFHLPESLFNGTKPRLRHLQLSNCTFAWDMPLLGSLTHFEIHKTNISKMTMAQVLAALDRMPLLETLVLDDALPAVPADFMVAGTNEPIVHFPTLHRLEIVGPVLGCSFLLRHLSYRSKPTLKLRCLAPLAGGGDFSSLFPIVSSFGGEEGGKAIQSLMMEVNPTRINITGWTHFSRGLSDIPITATPQIELSFVWFEYFGVPIHTQVTTIMRPTMLPLSQVRSLTVKSTATIGIAGWLETFRRMTALSEVHVCGQSADGLIDALIDGEKCEKATSLFLPQLQELLLTDVDFHGVVSFERLQDCLMARCYHGSELQGLHLQDCRFITQHEVNLLEEIVVDVYWDGIIHVTETDSDEEEYEDDYEYRFDDNYSDSYYDSDDYSLAF